MFCRKVYIRFLRGSLKRLKRSAMSAFGGFSGRAGISASLASALVLAAVLVVVFGSFGSSQGDGSCGSFVLRGTVLNSSFHNATSNNVSIWNSSYVNVSIYNMSFSQFGEPQRKLVNMTNTSSMNVSFELNVGANSCSVLYTLDVVAYNMSGWNAFEVGPAFPPLPQQALKGFLDNGTIYLQPAATLNLTAQNETHNISFSRIIFDDSLGFPISEDFMSLVWNATIVVPRAKNFTLMLMRPPDFTSVGNPFNLAMPPQTIRVQNASNYTNTSFVITLTKNLSFSQYIISGNITIDGTNATPVNMTQIVLKLGIAGMIPPNSDIQMQNGVTINYTPGGGTHIANYSVVVMGSESGIYQIVEFYASNTTATSSGFGDYYAYFSNFTVTGSMSHNLTLKRLSGNYSTVTIGNLQLNTSFICINITDSSGLPLDDAHIEIKVDNVGHRSYFPTFRYMADQLSGGIIRLPVLNDSNATVLVFNRRYAPLKFRLNISNASRGPGGIINIALNTFKPRKFQENGSFEDFSGSKAGQFKFIFMKNSAECNVFNASVSSCRLFPDDFDAGKFDPLKVMVTGKVNLLLEINTTGVRVYFVGVDMLASGPPEAAMSENPLQRTSNGTFYQEVFRFGSAAPNIYDRVFVGIHYNQSLVNDAGQINFTIRELYDETGHLAWNSSVTPNSSIPPDWSDYDTGWFNTTNGGMKCTNSEDSNATNATCFVNTTTNYVWVHLPHFSDDAGGPQGDPDVTPPAAPVQVNVSATVGGNIMINWTDSLNESGETYIIYSSAFNITNITFYGHNVSNYTGNSVFNLTNITAARVGQGVGFYVDNYTLNGTARFYAVAAVDSAGNLQNATGGQINLSNSNNATANDTVAPKVPANITLTASDNSVTITWLNVTQDINGESDFYNITYYIYRSNPNQTANLSGGNVTYSNITNFVKSVPGSSFNSTSVTGLVRGVYHFAVLAIDDGSNANLSVHTSGNYANVSVTPTSSSGDGTTGSGSGGGGGGGGGTGSDEGVKVSKQWDVLPAGTATMSLSKAEIAIKAIDFAVGNAVSNAGLTVVKLEKAPVLKRDVQGKAFQYLRIDKTNIKDADISEVKFEFAVDKKWFDQNNGNVKDVVLQRYYNDLWTSLDTSYKRSDTTHNFFEATSPGFSYFAIVLKPAAAKTGGNAVSNETAANTANLTGNQSDTGNGTVSGKTREGGGSIILFVIIAVAAVAVAGSCAFFISRRRGGSGGGFRLGLPGLLKRSRPGRGYGKSKSEDEDAASIVKEYEQQKSQESYKPSQDQRGRPPEAFN